jgi:hypothetical protein
MADKKQLWQLLNLFQPLYKFKEDVSDHLPRIVMNGVGEDSERVQEKVICLQNKLLFIADFSKLHPLSANEVFLVGKYYDEQFCECGQ